MNIILAGVGGQGLVLLTDMICEVAHRAGYDVKSNDVVGLSQRGGKVWGSVRFGEHIYSPNVRKGDADFVVAPVLLVVGGTDVAISKGWPRQRPDRPPIGLPAAC